MMVIKQKSYLVEDGKSLSEHRVRKWQKAENYTYPCEENKMLKASI